MSRDVPDSFDCRLRGDVLVGSSCVVLVEVVTTDASTVAGRSREDTDSLDFRLRRERVFLTGISCVTSVDAVTSDLLALEADSGLDTDSLDLRLRRGLDSARGSGVLLSQASKRLPDGFVGVVVSWAAGMINGVAASSWVLGYDLRLFFREGFGMGLVLSSSVRAPLLLGRRRRRLSRSSSSRGEVIRLSLMDGAELSAYSTVTTLRGSSLCTEPDLRPVPRVHGVKGMRSSADKDARGDVRARRLLRLTLTISVFSFSACGEMEPEGAPSLFASFPLPAPLLAGR